MTLADKMNEGIQEIQVKLALAKAEGNYNRKVRLMREVMELSHNYAEYWDDRLMSLME